MVFYDPGSVSHSCGSGAAYFCFVRCVIFVFGWEFDWVEAVLGLEVGYFGGGGGFGGGFFGFEADGRGFREGSSRRTPKCIGPALRSFPQPQKYQTTSQSTSATSAHS